MARDNFRYFFYKQLAPTAQWLGFNSGLLKTFTAP